MKALLRGVALASFVCTRAAAQTQEPAPPPPPQTVAPPKKAPPLAAVDQDFTLGVGYHGPTRWTGSATLMWGRPRMLIAWSPAKLVQARVGSGGAQLGIGFVAGAFEESAWKPSGVAVTLKVVGIRTWRDRDGLAPRSYAGVESDVVLLGIRGSIGYARKVGGGGPGGGRLIWSVGLGL